MKIRIVYADGEKNNLNAFFAYFRRNDNFDVLLCSSSQEMLSILDSNLIHISVIDQEILDQIGIDYFQMNKMRGIIKIAVTASRNMDILERATNEGKIFRYHSKPFDLDDLNMTINEAILMI